MAIHGLQNNRGRIENICRDILLGHTVAKPDMRGKHNNRPRQYSVEVIEGVHRHIKSIPTYTRIVVKKTQIEHILMPT